jgi:hypothetical protein
MPLSSRKRPRIRLGHRETTPRSRLYHSYATAVGQTLITYALESMRQRRILAACNPLNAASEHVLHHKLNMRFECEVEVRLDYRRRVYVAAADWHPLTKSGPHQRA